MGGQFIWTEASYDQLQVLANVPKLTSLLSIAGSCYILFDICRLDKRNTYHRIIFGMNVMDLLALIAWFFTTWPMPQDTEGVVGAKGNQGTCDAQGFFSQLSIATVLYNACLAIYFMLVIKWGWTEQRIKAAKLEYYIHALCIGVGIGTAIVAQIFGLYNPAGWQCWIAPAPTGCTESWHADKDDNNSRFLRLLQGGNSTTATENNATTTTAVDTFPCTRGDNANLFLWFFFYLPLWACIIVATVALYQVYSAFQEQDLVAAKWRQKLMNATAAPSKMFLKTTKATTRVASKATSNTVKATSKTFSHISSRTINQISSFVPSTKERSPPPQKPTYTPAQLRKLRSQESPSFDNSQMPNKSELDAGRNTMDASKDIASPVTFSRSNSGRTNMSNSGRTNITNSTERKTPSKGLPPLLGARPYTVRTQHPKVKKDLTKRAKKANRESKSKKTQKDKRVKKQHSVKSKLVTSQALLYLLSFYLAWFFPTLTRIQESVTSEGIAYYHWMLLSAIFVPLQGLMNFVVYIRPKLLQIRREKKRLAALKERQEELETNTAFHHPSTNSTFGGVGSSSALMTTTSMSNEHRHHNEHDGSEEEDDALPLALSLSLSDGSLQQFHRGGPADLVAGALMENETHDYQDEEGSINQDDALEDLFGAMDNSGNVRCEERPTLQTCHSSKANMLHMHNSEGGLSTNKQMMEQFNKSVCYDSKGHVVLSVADKQSSQQKNGGWKALQNSILGGLRRSASSMSSSTSAKPDLPLQPPYTSIFTAGIATPSGACISDAEFSTDLAEPFQQQQDSNVSKVLPRGSGILDSEFSTELSEALQQPQDVSFASGLTLFRTATREENGDHDAIIESEARQSHRHAMMDIRPQSQPQLAGKKKHRVQRSGTDPQLLEEIRDGMRASRRRPKSGANKATLGRLSFADRGGSQRIMQRRISKRQLMSAAKGTSKKGVRLVKGGIKGGLKGGKSGIKSIRNFAFDFKDALRADAMDDWATALNEDSDDNNAEYDGSDDGKGSRIAYENVEEVPKYNGEEEKEEIGVIYEDHTNSRYAAEGMKNKEAFLLSVRKKNQIEH